MPSSYGGACARDQTIAQDCVSRCQEDTLHTQEAAIHIKWSLHWHFGNSAYLGSQPAVVVAHSRYTSSNTCVGVHLFHLLNAHTALTCKFCSSCSFSVTHSGGKRPTVGGGGGLLLPLDKPRVQGGVMLPGRRYERVWNTQECRDSCSWNLPPHYNVQLRGSSSTKPHFCTLSGADSHRSKSCCTHDAMRMCSLHKTRSPRGTALETGHCF